jgi:hypothetical protein
MTFLKQFYDKNHFTSKQTEHNIENHFCWLIFSSILNIKKYENIFKKVFPTKQTGKVGFLPF